MKDINISKATSIIIFIAFIAFLVFITINRPPVDNSNLTGQAIGSIDMENSNNEGVKVTILTEGVGDASKPGDTVAMNYTGMLVDGTVFDSNIDEKFEHVEPFIFTIGAGQVITGWDVGIRGMKVGEKRRLEISPDQAYGEAGAGGVIPPNATLIFEVELLAIK